MPAETAKTVKPAAVASLCCICELRPEGRNRRGETQLRGPEVLGHLRGLGIRPLVSVVRGLGDPFPEAP